MQEREQEEDFFLENAVHYLISLRVPSCAAKAIANSLMELMLDGDRYYHTIAHINNIFSYVTSANIVLSERDALAVLFHDAVYTMGSKTNEQDSADLMLAMLRGHPQVDAELIRQAREIILTTANHLSHTQSPEAHLVLDLDLTGLAQDRGDFASDNRMIDKEVEAYAQRIGISFPLDKRIGFLKQLLERPTLYYKLTQLELLARENLAWLIAQYTQQQNSA